MAKDRDRDRDSGGSGTPTKSSSSTPTKSATSTNYAPNPNTVASGGSKSSTSYTAITSGGSGYQGGGTPAHGGGEGGFDPVRVEPPATVPVNLAPTAKPEAGVIPGVPVDTDKPVQNTPATKARRATNLTLGAIKTPAARSSPKGARQAKKETKAPIGASTRSKTAKVHRTKAETKTPPARSSAPNAAREAKKVEPMHCKARPKDNRTKGGGSRGFVPWCR